MRTKIGILLFCLAMTLSIADFAKSIDVGTVTTADYLRIPLVALDAAGVDAIIADSGYIQVFFEGEATANASSYDYAWTTVGATDGVIDSIFYRTNTIYYFFDLIADIDGAQGDGQYSGIVGFWDDGVVFKNPFSFTLYDGAETELIYDSVGIAALNSANTLFQIDSLAWASGLKGVARSVSALYNDVDTLFYLIVNDTIRARIYFHTGGYPGAPDDSSRTVNW